MDLIGDVRAHGLLEAGRPVVVMLSGGRDSVCLLDLAVRVAGPDDSDIHRLPWGDRMIKDDVQASEKRQRPIVDEVSRSNARHRGRSAR